MANILIPERFREKLQQGDQLFLGIILKTAAEFGEILEDNKLYFFEEYTDHGIKHIQQVLASSDNLVTKDTFDTILSAKDAGCYVLAVVLHDLAMHLSLDGFIQLLNGTFDGVRMHTLDKLTWQQLWADYLNEAQKFNEKQLLAIFGTENISIHPPALHDKGSITNNDKKLIGEFIRRHHPRLAHEIAIKGFPGGQGTLEFAGGMEPKLKDLVGLVARSHGMGLRACIDYIEDNFGRLNKRHPLGVHAVYLMVLLRIADYIQIDSSRTSKTLIKLKTFASPYSEGEHQTHLSVDDIDTRYQDDPERIYVQASPKDSMTYLKLKNLIADIQYEMDISWAVLGEHYGNTERPEIKYRRITSNLGEEWFLNRQQYIPDSFSFKAGDEIIKLMIAPLYGNDPSFGVRELLQNAVDACKEREELERKNGNNAYTPLITAAVTKDEDEQAWFTITDNGLGMNADIIKHYFLKAGASYRKSTEWQKTFIDAQGHTIVRRNGRFGVGLLAAFLIGKTIHVSTRRTGEEYGYTFTAGLHTTQINITKDYSLPVGTSIKISISEDTLNEMDPEDKDDDSAWFKWYTLSSPAIQYSYLQKPFKSYQRQDPDLHDELPDEWQAFDSAGYNKIHWTYSKDFSGAGFSCNGIIIPSDEIELYDIEVIPKVAVFDYEGNLPLTLDRSRFSGHLTFRKDLSRDIYKDFIAYVLTVTGISQVHDQRMELRRTTFNYPAFIRNNGRYTPYDMNAVLFSKEGFLLNADYCIRQLGRLDVLFIQWEEETLSNKILEIDAANFFIQLDNTRINAINDYSLLVTEDSNRLFTEDDDLEWDWNDAPAPETDHNKPAENDPDRIGYIKSAGHVFLKKERYGDIFHPTKKRIPLRIAKEHKINIETPEWTSFHLSTPKTGIVTADFVSQYASGINFLKEYELKRSTNIFMLNELLAYYLGKGKDVIIPYDLEARREKFPLAFKELERYMRKYK